MARACTRVTQELLAFLDHSSSVSFDTGWWAGPRGQALFETLWAKVLDQPTSHLFDLASAASQRGLLEFRHGGGVVEISFHDLLRRIDLEG